MLLNRLAAFVFSFGVFTAPALSTARADDVKADLKNLVNRIETVLDERDQKIEALEARLKELEARLEELESGAGAKAASLWSATDLSNAFLGVGHTDVPADLLAKSKVDAGAFVTDVLSDSPAATGGLQKGDIVVAINGKAVGSEDLSTAVQSFKPGASIKVSYLRGDQKADAEITLVDKEKFWVSKVAEPLKLGVLIGEDEGALVIQDVEEGAAAGIAGFKLGDKLTHINGSAVKSLEDVGAALQNINVGDRVTFQVHRGDSTVTSTIVGSNESGKSTVVVAKSVTPGVLGVEVEESDVGAVVTAVTPETAAASFGIQPGDVVKSLNGQDVTKLDALTSAARALNAGDKVNLVVSRNGQDLQINNVTIGAEGEKIVRQAVLGIEGLDEEGGVVVEAVAADSSAAAYGVKTGDVIKKFNGADVTEQGSLTAAFKGINSGNRVSLVVQRGDEQVEIKDVLLGGEGDKVPDPNVPAVVGIEAEVDDAGAVVDVITPGSAAAVYGVKKGDVIKSLNGIDVSNADTLLAEVAKLTAGETISLVVQRDGSNVVFKKMLLGAVGQTVIKPKVPGYMRLVILESDDGRVVIATVTPGGAAEDAGLTRDDEILALNGKGIANGDDLATVLKGHYAGDLLRLKYRRGEEEKEIDFVLGE